MAANDARAFPEYGVAFLACGVMTLNTNKEIAGAMTNLAAWVSKDNGPWVACANAPAQQGTTGIVSVLLSAAEQTAYNVDVKFVQTTIASANDLFLTWQNIVWTSKNGRGQSRFEELVRKVAEFAINQATQSGAALSTYCDDGITVSVAGAFTPGDTSAVRSAMN